MSSRLPRAARTTAKASLPPAGLPGMRAEFSRLVPAAGRTWHVLDNAAALDAATVVPRGTILCVHGNPTWSFLWRSLVSAATDQALAGGTAWRVIAVDQLDMGFSERTGLERDLTRRVGDLADLTDVLAVDGPVVTFGHDWGGIISLGWAVDHRDGLEGVMLLNTAVHQPESSKIPAPLRLALGKGVLGRATVSTPAFLETTLALAHPPLAGDVKDGYRAPYRGAHRRGGVGGFVADIPVGPEHRSEAERRRVAEALRELDVPALMLWGPRDPIFSDRYLDDLVDRMPHADVHRFEGAGHLIADDVDFASAALSWLDARVENPTIPDPTHSAPSTAAPHRPLLASLDARSSSDATAMVEMARGGSTPPRVVTWRALARRVDHLAKGLISAGVAPGDRVSLLVPPGVDLTCVLYACLRIGAVVVVADAGLGVKGLTRAVTGAWPAHIVGALPGLTAARALGWPGRTISVDVLPAAAARALGVTASLPELVSRGAASTVALPDAPVGDATAAILFTSGSTGPAKGVVYTHARLAALCEVLSTTYGVTSETGIVAGFAPFALLGPALGARSVTPDMDVTSPGTLTASAVGAAAEQIDADMVFLSPAAVASVVATGHATSRGERRALAAITTVLSAGAPVSPALLDGLAHVLPGATAHTPYGMTEGLLMSDITLEQIVAADDAIGGVCVGVPVSGVDVRIAPLDAAGRASSAFDDHVGVTGEIVVRAAHALDHYDRLWLTDVAATRGTPVGEKWHRTGDVGHLDLAGHLWVEGRLPHVITTTDGPVTPVALEQRLEALSEVVRAAAVGVGPTGTQQIVVVVETVTRAHRSALADETLARSARTAIDRPLAAVFTVPLLPTDVRHNSKIDRTALSAWAAGVLAGGPLVAP